MSVADSGSVLRNTLLNFTTQGGLVVLAFWGIPILTEGLGEADFGILTILWAFVGYFSLLDLGTSRAVTRAVAHHLSMNNIEGARRAAWAGLSFALVVGLTTAVILASITPLIVGEFVGVGQKQMEVQQGFLLGAIGIPFMLVFGSTTGIFMALQKFGPVNVYRALVGLIQWIGSAVLIWIGQGFLAIITLTVASRILMGGMALLTLSRVAPLFFRDVRFWEWKEIRALVSFGGWVSISQLISPLFIYFDRFLIGSMISIGAVAYYALPQEALVRLSIVPLSLTTALFPVLSQQESSSGDTSYWRDLYRMAIRHLFHVVLPIIVLLILFAEQILEVWVGPTYAEKSTLVFQIIAAGFLANALAQIPASGLQSLGRPDLAAKFHLLELPVFILMNILLIPLFGITAVAILWAGRAFVDAVLLGVAVERLKSIGPWAGHVFVEVVLAGICTAGLLSVESLSVRAGLTAIILLVYSYFTWQYSLDDRERKALRKVISSGRTRTDGGRRS